MAVHRECAGLNPTDPAAGLVATRMAEKMSGTIPPEESARGYVAVVEQADTGSTDRGIFAYDGEVYPW